MYKHRKNEEYLIKTDSNLLKTGSTTQTDQKFEGTLDSETNFSVESNVLNLSFDFEFDELKVSLESSNCIFPFFLSSDSQISFSRESRDPESFHLSNLGQSNMSEFVDSFDAPKRHFSISTRSKTGDFRSFFYIICPFFSTEKKSMKVSLRPQIFSKKIAKETESGFDTNLPWETFINQLFLDSKVTKKSMRDLIDPKEATQYNLNFDTNGKFLVYVIDPVFGFSMKSNIEVDFIYILSEDFKTYTQVAKERNQLLDVNVELEKVEEGEKQDELKTQSKGHYFYFERAQETQIALMIAGNNGNTTFMSILENNWKYFLFLFLFIFLIILWKVIKRIRNKIREKNRIHQKLNEKKKQEDIENQRKSRRLTRILNIQRKTLSGTNKVTQESDRHKLQSQLDQLSMNQKQRRQSVFYSHRKSENQTIKISQPKMSKLDGLNSTIKEENDPKKKEISRDSIDVFESLDVRRNPKRNKSDHRKRLSQAPRMVKKQKNHRFSVRSKKSKKLKKTNFTFQMEKKKKSITKSQEKKQRPKTKQKTETETEESNKTYIYNINDSVVTTEMGLSVIRDKSPKSAKDQ